MKIEDVLVRTRARAAQRQSSQAARPVLPSLFRWRPGRCGACSSRRHAAPRTRLGAWCRRRRIARRGRARCRSSAAHQGRDYPPFCALHSAAGLRAPAQQRSWPGRHRRRRRRRRGLLPRRKAPRGCVGRCSRVVRCACRGARRRRLHRALPQPATCKRAARRGGRGVTAAACSAAERRGRRDCARCLPHLRRGHDAGVQQPRGAAVHADRLQREPRPFRACPRAAHPACPP